VGGVLAGVVGDTMLCVSGGAEHQGPCRGAPVAIIAKVAWDRERAWDDAIAAGFRPAGDVGW